MSDLVKELLTFESLASFITTMLGVFVGFLLSAWQYNKQKKRTNNELELKYTIIIKEEMDFSRRALNESLKNINEFLLKNELINKDRDIIDFKNLKSDEIKEFKAEKLFISIMQYLESLITDRALLSAFHAGSTEVVLLNNVKNAYHSYDVAINNLKPDFINLQKGLSYSTENPLINHLNNLINLRVHCKELNEIYLEGIKELNEFEKRLG